jgi:hypothetical protein
MKVDKDDPIYRLGLRRCMELSADVEVQLRDDVQGGRPVVAILQRARHEAAEAMVGLYAVDPYKPEDIWALKNKIARYDDLVRWLRDIVQTGIEADTQVNSEEREELIELLCQTPEGQQLAQEQGLINGDGHAD